jgi:lysophospholipase L1-like esterase
VSTKAEQKASKVFSFSVEDGPRKMQLRSAGGGDVRLFGVALERDVPGVVYDALGANGAQSLLWEPVDDTHWKDQMALRKPALVILQFGTNESEAPVFGEKSYEKTLTHVLEKVKAAAEGASVMLVAPLDRAEREAGELRTKKIIPKIVASQKKVALANGCAFWNTYEAMGGEGSMAKWVKAKPQLASWDLTHPTPAGAEVIGELFEKALVTGFEAYVSRAP